MKALVIYFSQTGNMRRIARCIHDGIIDVTGRCDMTNLNDVDVNLLSDYDLVGIGCPVFYYKEPFNVTDFIESLPEIGGAAILPVTDNSFIAGASLSDRDFRE